MVRAWAVAVPTTALPVVGAQGGDGSGQLWAALLGAVVGGVLTLAGSIVVNRIERRTAGRLRMYDELLPRLRAMHVRYAVQQVTGGSAAPTGQDDIAEVVAQLRRASVLAGRDERRIAGRIQKAATARTVMLAMDWESDGMGGQVWRGDEARRRELNSEIGRGIEELDAYLAKRLD
jgi:hypothetical protein